MDKVRTSESINVFLGGERELLCYRIYVEARLWGSFWIWSEVVINLIFYIIRQEKNHVKGNYLWEMRRHAKAKIQARKVSIEKAEEPHVGDEASQKESEA